MFRAMYALDDAVFICYTIGDKEQLIVLLDVQTSIIFIIVLTSAYSTLQAANKAQRTKMAQLLCANALVLCGERQPVAAVMALLQALTIDPASAYNIDNLADFAYLYEVGSVTCDKIKLHFLKVWYFMGLSTWHSRHN